MVLSARSWTLGAVIFSAVAVSTGSGQAVAFAPNLCSLVPESIEYTILEGTQTCSSFLASSGAGNPCTCLDDVSYDNA
jgi:hypothetical protein